MHASEHTSTQAWTVPIEVDQMFTTFVGTSTSANPTANKRMLPKWRTRFRNDVWASMRISTHVTWATANTRCREILMH